VIDRKRLNSTPEPIPGREPIPGEEPVEPIPGREPIFKPQPIICNIIVFLKEAKEKYHNKIHVPYLECILPV
jgi:hypothetical protein